VGGWEWKTTVRKQTPLLKLHQFMPLKFNKPCVFYPATLIKVLGHEKAQTIQRIESSTTLLLLRVHITIPTFVSNCV
jgi:hypothetical protein